MAGLFDDLIPAKPATPAAPTAPATSKAGLFNDLIPSQQTAPPVAGPNAVFKSLPPETPPAPALPSGAFDIIDKAAQAEQARAAGGYQPEIDPLTDKPVEPPFSLGRTATSLAEGANIKALEMLMLPLLLGTAAAQGGAKVLGLPPPTDYPAKIRQSFVEGQPVQPENIWERGAYRGGEQAMLNAPLALAAPGFGMAFSAARTPSVPVGGLFPNVKGVAETIGRTAAAAPRSFLAGDVASNVGSGIGAEIGKETGGPWGELLGGTAGGILPAAYPKWISPTGIAARVLAKVAPSIVDAAAGAVPGVAERGVLASQYANREGIYADPSIPNPNSGSWVKEALAAAAERQSAKLRGRVAGQLEKYTSEPEAQAGLDEAAALRQQIPGFSPSVAKATGSQPLLNQERTIGTAATGEALTAMRDQAAQNAAAINRFAGGRVPPVTGAAPADQQVIDLLTRQAQAADRGAAQGTADIENRIRDLTSGLPERPAIQTGEQLRGARDVAERTMNEEVARRRAAIDPGGTFREPTTNLYTSIVSRLNNLGTDLTNAVIPPKVREILGNTRPQTILDAQGQPAGRWAPTYDIDSLLTAREQVGQKLRQLGPVQSVEAAGARDALSAVRDGIDAEVARISQVTPPPGGPQITQQPRALETTVGGRPEAVTPGVPAPAEQPSTVQSRLADFNRFYREEYVPRFRQDLGAELGQTRASGQEVIKPEDIAPRLLAPNAVSEMRQFNLIHGEDPAARETVINAALDDIRRGVGPGGMMSPEAVTGWVQKHSRILDEAPWLREAVAGRDPTQLYQRLGQAEAARRATADENLTGLLGRQPSEAIDAGLKDPRVMRQLANNARSAGPDAEAALRRAVWERAVGAGGGKDTTLPDPTKLREFLANNEDSLRHVLSPEHKTDLETIARAAEIEGQLPPPRGAAEEPTTVSSVVQGLTGSGIPSILNKVFAFASGRVPKGYLSADVGLRVLNNFNEQEARRVWREALFNPDVARTIADAVRSGKATQMQTQKLKSYLLQAPGNAIEDVKRRQEENQ